MTVEEAKKILEKEGFELKGPGRAGVVSKFYTKYESPKICEAMQIVCSAGYEIMMLAGVFEARKERLKLELAENTKAPDPGEEKPKEKKGIIYPTTFPKDDFYYKHVLNEGNPAIKESASQFNDALLDEQAKKIEELTKDKELMKKATLSQLDDFIEIYNLLTKESQKAKRLGKEIARLNKNIYKKNLKINELRKESSRHLRGKIKMFGENVDLEQMLKDKNAVLSDVAEELRLSKIREKNLVEVSQKYTKENEELKKELKRANNLVEMVCKGSKEYCEYGIAAEKMIQKLAKIIVGKGSVTSEDFEKCRHWAKGYRFNPQLPELSEEEKEKLKHAKKYRVSYDKAKEGGDQSVVTIVQCDNGITLSKEEVEIIERCTKNGMELHYSEKDGLTYTNMFGEEIPIICLRGMFHIFTDEEIKNMKK